MLEEYEVPIPERVLILEGRASKSVCKNLPNPFQNHSTSGDVVFFSSFAYANLPLGKCFDLVFRYAAPNQMELAECLLVAVTQQFSVLEDNIPHGWKTICLFRFSPEIPNLVKALPEVDGWYESSWDGRLGLATRETWNTIVQKS